MAEETDLTPQGKIGASDGDQSSSSPEEKGSLLGAEAGKAADDGEDNSLLEGDAALKNDPLKEEEGKTEGEGEKEGEDPEGVPENYADFEMPEGMTLDNAVLEKATPVLKELGLNQEQAQKAVSLYADLQAEAVAAQKKAVDDLRATWVSEIKSDPKHPQMLADAKKAVDHFGDDAAKELLYSEWLGDNPSMVRFLGKIGAAMSNDSFVEGGRSTSAKEAPEALFDDMAGLPGS